MNVIYARTLLSGPRIWGYMKGGIRENDPINAPYARNLLSGPRIWRYMKEAIRENDPINAPYARNHLSGLRIWRYMKEAIRENDPINAPYARNLLSAPRIWRENNESCVMRWFENYFILLLLSQDFSSDCALCGEYFQNFFFWSFLIFLLVWWLLKTMQ